MRELFENWESFLGEGLAQKYKFDTSVDIITDEVLSALKSGINNSARDGSMVEFEFVNGKSTNGRTLPQELKKFVSKVSGRVRFSSAISDPSDAGVVGGYQGSKKYMMLFVNVPVDFTMQDIRPSALVAKIKTTLRHELEHTLDDMRGIEKKVKGGLRGRSLEDYENYFTSPHEINAYTVGFHKRAKLTGETWVDARDRFVGWLRDILMKKVNAEKTWDRLKVSERGPMRDEYATEEQVSALMADFVRLTNDRYEERYG